MKKLLVGHNFEIPKSFKDYRFDDIGGYKIVDVPEKGIFVCGRYARNIFDMPICQATIIPVTKEKLSEGKDVQEAVYNTHNLEDGKVYFYITYHEYSYIFNNMNDAFRMLSAFVQVKTLALDPEWLNKWNDLQNK